MLKRYYEGTTRIINKSQVIGKRLGFVDASYIRIPANRLRKENMVKKIHSSLQIEGNSLSIDQVNALFENKLTMGPAKEILEVQNAINVYKSLFRLDPFQEQSYLQAHRLLMKGLMEKPGQYRTDHLSVSWGEMATHQAPPARNVPNSIANLFAYLRKHEDNLILKSCVFHYKMEFIQPFMDGNGRMGKLWQTLILMRENPIFEFLPMEAEIQKSQSEYYAVLAASDNEEIATSFVEYMLGIISKSLKRLIDSQRIHLTDLDRLAYFRDHASPGTFSRKDYMEVFKDISPATASRDLRKGVEKGLLSRSGNRRNSRYSFMVI